MLMEGRDSKMNPTCDIVNGREIPAGSSDFQLVLHQLHIHETWKDAAGKTVAHKVGKDTMELHKKDKSKKDNRNCDTRDRANSFTKLKRFLNINPKPSSPPHHDDKHKHGRATHGKPSPNPVTSPTLSPSSPCPLSPALKRTQLQVQEDSFRERAHSDSSAMKPRRKKAILATEEQTSPLDNLHVHWPDERDGDKLATLLRPRSLSHGSGERPARPILKKSSSRTVYY